ncbi:MAG: hypothetical protein RR330_01660 [Alistipes sp.]
MKKTFLSGLLLLVSAATLTNCTKDEAVFLSSTPQTTLSATVEEPTRTILDGAQVQWLTGDKIMVAHTDTKATAEYTLTEGAGTTSGIFAGNDLGQGAKIALYPYQATATYTNDHIEFELPAQQTYTAKTFANGANPMIAQSNAQGTLQFKNLCGAICLQLKGTHKVGKIVMITAAEKITGKATIATNYTADPALVMDAGASNLLTLACGSVQLNATTATPFYMVVPAAAYSAGVKFLVVDDAGVAINTLTATKVLTVNRSRVAKLAEQTLVAAKFPDPKFREVLVNTYGFTPTADGKDIDVTLAANQNLFATTTVLALPEKGLVSLTGIEYFTAITTLNCNNNSLTNLDVSRNPQLQILYCSENSLTNLNVSQNLQLQNLYCNQNSLTNLNVSQNSQLRILWCFENKITSLDLRKSSQLVTLYCHSNLLTNLDVNQNSKLCTFHCYNNSLVSLDVNRNLELYEFQCYNNSLTILDISNNPTLANCVCGAQTIDGKAVELTLRMTAGQKENKFGLDGNPNNIRVKPFIVGIQFPDAQFRAALVETYGFTLTTDGTDIDVNLKANQDRFAQSDRLDVTHRYISSLAGIEYFTGLSTLWCDNNLLTNLDLSKNLQLLNLYCHYNSLTNLNLGKNSTLGVIECYGNQLTKLDVHQCKGIGSILCYQNQLTNLDLSQNALLAFLHCYDNLLANLDLSKNSELRHVLCYNNSLTDFKVRDNLKLEKLYCYNNSLPKLDVYSNHQLTDLKCGAQAVNQTEMTLTLTMGKAQYEAKLAQDDPSGFNRNIIFKVHNN